MATSAPGENPAYIVTTDIAVFKDTQDVYGFSLSRNLEENTIELMVEDQSNCQLERSQLIVRLERDRLIASVDPKALVGLRIPSEYVVTFTASQEQLSAMHETLRVICNGVAVYSRQL